MQRPTTPRRRVENARHDEPATIATRNRTNARLSTGPKSPGSKSITRRNAVRHGLTANPAAGVAEDPAEFRRLLRGVEDRLQPCDVIESSLCHRIAVAIWRLQRAARLEAAAASQGENGVVPYRALIQEWIERITNFWKVDLRWETVPERDESIRRPKTVKQVVTERAGLHTLDGFRDEHLMKDGAGITAMMSMIENFMEWLERGPGRLSADGCEQFAWLLGMSCHAFPINSDESHTPDPAQTLWPIWWLIGSAVRRPQAEAVPEPLRVIVRQRLDTLRAQRQVCEVPFSIDEWRDRRTLGLLGDEAMLDRIMRYETHADRSLNRALDTLAKLRGSTVESIAASMRGVQPDGTAVEVRGKRTRWTPGATLAKQDSAKRSQCRIGRSLSAGLPNKN